VSLAIVVTCDSDPAPYAPGERCSAWLPTGTAELGEALHVALRAGWSYEYHRTGGAATSRTTCPACQRARPARTEATP
jgi:hypothetical protein